tara:strand:+ start:12057 stop:12815 length:759 start_codon:yes stop_codon:yes gene_type:complete
MSLWQKAKELEESAESFVIATLISVRGGAPQDPGAKAIISQHGLEFGTVGGGKVEARVISDAKEILTRNQLQEPVYVKWNLQTDIGMTCGGEVNFVFEHFPASHWPIVIFGAGHVSQALTRTLANLPCQITCIDDRKEWIDKLSIKGIVHPHPSELVKEIDPNSYFICMTQGHAKDTPILKAISEHAPNCPYVGVIGSKTKGITIKRELKELGVSEEFIQKLRVPIGLPLGTNHPFEISISIAAELLQVRDL